MSELKFTPDHEWIRLTSDDLGVVGITEFAQEQLGELVYIELPEVGAVVSKGAETAVIESVKAAGELNAPASGKILEVNQSIADDPAIVNRDAMGQGWFLKLSLSAPGELEDLMDEDGYRAYVADLD